jgi:hypothetical protein
MKILYIFAYRFKNESENKFNKSFKNKEKNQGFNTKKSTSMEKLILTKTQKGNKYLYEVKNEAGEVVAKRHSSRDYVACTSNGELFFGRIDLINKGEHARQILVYMQGSTNLSNGESYRKYCQESLDILRNIAYLQQ